MGGRHPSHVREAAVRLYVEDERPSSDVARTLGVSQPTVCQWVREAGHGDVVDDRGVDHSAYRALLEASGDDL